MIDGQIENEIKEIKEVNNIVDDIKDDISISNNNIDIQKNEIDEWNLDGIQIFNSAKTSVLDSLYESSKKKEKKKKVLEKE